MKSILTAITLLSISALLAVPGYASEVFVAPNGSDTNPGTKSKPFATLVRAQEAVRKLKAAGPVTVTVREGIYGLSSTLSFTSLDSGTSAAPITWRAYPGEKALVIGGKTIGGFSAYQGKILKTDVSTQGFQSINFHQLICNGKRMDLARYPNRDAQHPVTGGWAYVDGAPIPMYQNIDGEPQNLLKYRASDQRQWAHPEQAEVMVFPRYNWWNDIIGVASIDTDKRTITLRGSASYPIRPGDRYFVQNLFEELDAPGEWFLDKTTRTLYFWPPDGANTSTMTVAAPALDTILELKDGAANITFRGFTFECSERDAIRLAGTNNCRIAACTVRCVGGFNGSAVVVDGGKHNGVVGCDIYDIGRNAISLNGGDFKTLQPAGNYADNNYIHHMGVYYKQGVGVELNGVGNRISHNLIHDCPRFGIGWGGCDHVMEYNEIRHCDLETADCGAIYSWQVDWTKRGTQIRYNYLHDIIGFGQENGKWTSPHMNWGVYLDDGTCGTIVYGNIVARTILGGVHVHGGRDNVIDNNILVDGRDSQVQYSGYVSTGHEFTMLKEAWAKFPGNSLYAKYPGYTGLTKSQDDGWRMAGNSFTHNIVAYRDPKAAMFAHYNLPTDKTTSDYNLVWHPNGDILTGFTSMKPGNGPNLAPNPGFEQGEAGKEPTGWQWQVRPNDSQAQVDTAVKHGGKQSLHLEAKGAVKDSSGQTLTVNYVSGEIKLKPGQSYVLSAYVRADTPTQVSLTPQAYDPNKYFWSKSVGASADTAWKRIETGFRFPAKDDGDWHDGMGAVRIRFDISQPTGAVWLDDVELREASAVSGWQAWRNLGLDAHSVLADPLFVNRAADDYRLKPNSPAFKLGFKPIPVDKIGPYKDDLRATWPIKQALGAREQMTINWGR